MRVLLVLSLLLLGACDDGPTEPKPLPFCPVLFMPPGMVTLSPGEVYANKCIMPSP